MDGVAAGGERGGYGNRIVFDVVGWGGVGRWVGGLVGGLMGGWMDGWGAS